MAMLACARIGAVHSVVFGGFAPAEIATRTYPFFYKYNYTALLKVMLFKLVSLANIHSMECQYVYPS